MRTREEALSYGLSFPDTYQDALFHDEKFDLVFYHRILKCFVLIDLKQDEVQHEDIGHIKSGFCQQIPALFTAERTA